jgi:hypothetical protein
MHRGFRRSRQLECLVSCRTRGQRRCRNADERVYEDRSVVVVVIEHWHACRVICVRVIGPMHMDRTTTVMVGRVVVWMRVRQRSAHRGTLDCHRQRQRKRLSDHSDIVGDRGHLVKSSRWTLSNCAFVQIV